MFEQLDNWLPTVEIPQIKPKSLLGLKSMFLWESCQILIYNFMFFQTHGRASVRLSVLRVRLYAKGQPEDAHSTIALRSGATAARTNNASSGLWRWSRRRKFDNCQMNTTNNKSVRWDFKESNIDILKASKAVTEQR